MPVKAFAGRLYYNLFMTFETYCNEVTTLTTFVTHFCSDKHSDATKRGRTICLSYGGERAEPLEALLCDTCAETVAYGIGRLQGCPYDEKPKCRKCPDPCYARPMWKHVAAIMRYSGMKLGLTRIKKKIRFWTD
jgi:hypothetical protein